jgi:hypothetical protein
MAKHANAKQNHAEADWIRRFIILPGKRHRIGTGEARRVLRRDSKRCFGTPKLQI